MTAQLEGLKQQLGEERQQAARLRQEAASLVARLRGASRHALASFIAELNRDLEHYHRQVEPADPVALAPWTSAVWSGFSGQATAILPRSLRVGHTLESPLSTETPAQIPRMVSLIDARGALIFTCDAATREIARNLIANLLIRSALAAPGHVRFSLFDPHGLGAAFPMRSLLPLVRPSGRTSTDELEVIIWGDPRRRDKTEMTQLRSLRNHRSF